MKIEEVPQDNKYLESTTLRDLYYVVDSEGKYGQASSVGWEVKNEALSLTWDSISEEAEAVRQEVIEGKKSPLAYHMEMHLLDIGLMASYAGVSKKTVRKHLLPDGFNCLDEAALKNYAGVMNITVEALKTV